VAQFNINYCRTSSFLSKLALGQQKWLGKAVDRSTGLLRCLELGNVILPEAAFSR